MEQRDKDPSSIEPRGFDWTAWLAARGHTTISASTWVVSTIVGDPDPLTLDDDTIVAGSLKTQVTLAGGTVGRKYVVTNHITTAAGSEDERSLRVMVVQR